MFKNILIILFTLFFFLNINSPVRADKSFSSDVNVTYSVGQSGKTNVDYKITISNKTSDLHATYYLINLDSIQPKDVHVTENGNELNVSTIKDGDSTSLRIKFDNFLAGEGRQRTFHLSYVDENIAVKTGHIWEIYVPRLKSKESFDSYNVTLKVPDIVGEEAYVSPLPDEKTIENGEYIYLFKKSKIVKTGVKASFGKHQIYAFQIDYSLVNNEKEQKDYFIAIPPDTSIQRIYYDNIDPRPINITSDADGNWIAQYILNPKQRIDVYVKGYSQLFSSPRHLINPTPSYLLENIKYTKYWNSESDSIKTLAKTFSSPKDIYMYVTETLNYNKDRVGPEIQRKGSVWALENPNDSTCMEFTDLFIAIARASGIPAREVNGYAYSENPDIQPLSLVADVLHSWPEYWNDSLKLWVPVDPTWGSTSEGVDYFDELDLRHFAFVTHGVDDSSPIPPGSYKLGDNPQKSIFVNVGNDIPKYESQTTSSIKSKSYFPIISEHFSFKIENSPNIASYDKEVQILSNGNVIDSFSINVLAPGEKYEKTITFNYGLLGRLTPERIVFRVDGDENVVLLNKSKSAIYQIVIVLLLFLIIISSILFRKYIRKGKNIISLFIKKGN